MYAAESDLTYDRGALYTQRFENKTASDDDFDYFLCGRRRSGPSALLRPFSRPSFLPTFSRPPGVPEVEIVKKPSMST